MAVAPLMSSRIPPWKEEGLILPLALLGAAVLLLGALSLQGLLLVRAKTQAAEYEHLQHVENLSSAAQLFASRLAGPFSCIREMPSAEWPSVDFQQLCPESLDINDLRFLMIENQAFYLQGWTPGLQVGEMRIRPVESQHLSVFIFGKVGIRKVG